MADHPLVICGDTTRALLAVAWSPAQTDEFVARFEAFRRKHARSANAEPDTAP